MAATKSPQQKAAETRKRKALEAELEAAKVAEESSLAEELESDEDFEEESEEVEKEVSAEKEVAKAETAFDPTKKTASEVKAEQAEKVKLSEKEQHTADLARFRKEIEKCETSLFMVPLDPGEKVGATKVVSLNGLAFTIKKGAMVKLPMPIIEILAEQYKVEMEAGRHMLIDRDETIADALS